MPNRDARFCPIIYVRGYAMRQAEIDATAADPFCGFNLGSTMYRARADKKLAAKKFVFESPVVRLCSDFKYTDVYENGLDIMDEGWTGAIAIRSIIVYRYYDEASTLLGTGKTPEIEKFAGDLSKLILRVRELVCLDPANNVAPGDFRCYLVAHSMGGLVCRAFLQNPALGSDEARKCVAKVFTYATPHNGIDMGVMNVPSWLGLCDMSNFNRRRMAGYLNLAARFKKTKRVDWIAEEVFPSKKFFCMIGTNRGDYEAAHGLSRTFAGHGSDGLVRIANASVWGYDADGGESQPCATAYAYRSHSGYFGIVNSEESYQNLIRFLFGDVRVDIWADVESIRLPAELQEEEEKGHSVDGSYQFELFVGPKGTPWHLTRRVAEEDSVACLNHRECVEAIKDPPSGEPKSIYLSSVFLGNHWRVDRDDPSLSYRVMLRIRVPDYELNGSFYRKCHYEGAQLFNDAVSVRIVPPERDGGGWKVRYDWESKNREEPAKPIEAQDLGEREQEIVIPFAGDGSPGISGRLRFVVSAWNTPESS